jgi:hypothetical protein
MGANFIKIDFLTNSMFKELSFEVEKDLNILYLKECWAEAKIFLLKDRLFIIIKYNIIFIRNE